MSIIIQDIAERILKYSNHHKDQDFKDKFIHIFSLSSLQMLNYYVGNRVHIFLSNYLKNNLDLLGIFIHTFSLNYLQNYQNKFHSLLNTKVHIFDYIIMHNILDSLGIFWRIALWNCLQKYFIILQDIQSHISMSNYHHMCHWIMGKLGHKVE